MNRPTQTIDASNARQVVLWWRGVWFSLLAAFFSALSLAIGAYHHPFPWTGVLTGVMVALAGFQFRLAANQFDRIDTKPAPRWMRPIGLALYAAGAILIVFGVRAIAS
jgi:hypothetical protein